MKNPNDLVWVSLPPREPQSLPDLTGEHYIDVLRRFHAAVHPDAYLEVGTATGRSLAFVDCPSIAIDPKFRLQTDVVGKKPLCSLYQMTSDRFFAAHDPAAILGGPVDMAFLDGMHLCEFLLRDFANTERYCKQGAIIFLHDCVPVESLSAQRVSTPGPRMPHRHDWWLGDVWRTLLALTRWRPDLQIATVDAPPSGLAIVTNLDPANRTLLDNDKRIIEEMQSWSLDYIGLKNYHKLINLESTAIVDTKEKITARFCL